MMNAFREEVAAVVNFSKWCTTNKKTVEIHELSYLLAIPSKLANGKSALAAAIPSYYASEERLANLLDRFGKKKAAEFLRTKLPKNKSIRSGDLGEILAIGYVTERTDYVMPIKRLRWKDHREMAMRGDDLIAFRINANGRLEILKGEVKSRSNLSKSVIAQARKTLKDNMNRPSPHALSYIADRLHELGETELADRIDEEQYKRRISLSQVQHLLFVVSGNDAETLLEEELKSFKGKVRQHSVGLFIEKHEKFISDTYDATV